MHISFWVFVFWKLITSNSVYAEGPPRKLESEGHRQIIFAHVNESVTLKCPFESSSSDLNIFVDWLKGNASLYMKPGYEITNKGYLKIRSVSAQNAGMYTCEAINGFGAVRLNLTLVLDNEEMQNKNHTLSNRVHSPPPTIIKRPSSMAVDVGDEATFHCISAGQPVPRIFWLKDGHLIEGSYIYSYISKRKTHSTLKLKGVTKSDAGTYKCIARNVIGEDEMDFSLYVSEPSPPPKILALDPADVTIPEGATIAFVCEVASRPGVELHIKWLKRQDGIEESLPSNIQLLRFGKLYYKPVNLTYSEFIRNGGVYKSKLLIRNTCLQDSGTYVCLALNDKGFNTKNSTLKVIGRTNTFANPPHFPTSSTPLAVTITVGFVVVLAVIVFASHLCCRSKTEEKTSIDRTSMPNVETESLKHSMASVRKTNKGDFNPYPEIAPPDPLSTSKLLAIDSAFLYERSESQISKSAHTRTNVH